MSGEQIGVIAAAAILVFWMLGARKRLLALRNAIGGRLEQLAEFLQRRSAALGALAAVLRQPMSADPGTLERLLAADAQQRRALEALRQRPAASETAAAMVSAETALAASLARTLAWLEQHPQWRDDPTGAGPQLRVLKQMEPRLAFARHLYNEAVATYNDAARQWPTRLLTRVFGFGAAGRL